MKFILIFISCSLFATENYKILTDEEYKIALHALLNTSDYELFSEKTILSKITHQNSFLDIGPGPGSLTKKIMPYFSETTIIEPNQVYFDDFTGVKKFRGTLDEFTTECKYDFILCSHMLYHIPPTEWENTIAKMVSLLNPGGKLAIVMEYPDSDLNSFREEFNPTYLPSLIEETKNFPVTDTYISSHANTTQTESEMVTLLRFLILEDCFTYDEYQQLTPHEKEVIKTKLEQKAKASWTLDGQYKLHWKQIIVFISN